MTRSLFLRRALILLTAAVVIGAVAAASVLPEWRGAPVAPGSDAPPTTAQTAAPPTTSRTAAPPTTAQTAAPPAPSRTAASPTTSRTAASPTTAQTAAPPTAGRNGIAVPALSQYPDLPTGCEVTAAAMVLQYYGVDVTPQQFAGEWIACDSSFGYAQGEMFGPDPRKVFAGDPFSAYSYGCFEQPIVDAVLGQDCGCTAESVVGKSLPQLCEEYIDAGRPLLIWATMGMCAPGKGGTWRLPDGSLYTWPANEHCMVLVGYDDRRYYFNDPQQGATVSYGRAVTEARYEALGSRAVYIAPDE